MVSMASRLKFFDDMKKTTSVVCFAAGHRKIYTSDLPKLDVHCRKLFRRVVGLPADIDWNQPWHTIFQYTSCMVSWFQNVVNEIFIRILEICKLRCFTWWQSLGETHLALEPRRWEAWTSIFSMANSSTKFLPLASLRQLDWHCRKHRSLVSILHRLHFLLPVMMLYFSRFRV